MSDEEKNLSQEAPKEEQKVITYASPMKRCWAWVGVAYMVIIVLLFTYTLAFGSFLQGIGSLMFCPAVVGIAVSALILKRAGKIQMENLNQRMVFILVEILCGAVVLLNLYSGIPALIAIFGA
ncbi:MAG: hypothetical protein RR281_04670 [Pseudoflavonifractor sp.]